MNASVKFKHMGTNLSKMLYMISTNQNLLRYIKYLDNTPLDPVKADVDETEVDSQIVKNMLDPSMLVEGKIKLFFYPFEGLLETQPLGYDYYLIDIVIPSNYWILEGQGELRAFQMAYEIAVKLDGKEVAGIGKVEITKYKTYVIEKTYQGLTLWVKVKSVTIKA